MRRLVSPVPCAVPRTRCCCRSLHSRLEEAGIDKVYVFCVNDAAVMQAWKKDQGLAGSEMIEFLADKDADLTNALGIRLTGADKPYGQFEGPNNALGLHTNRCKRTAMFVQDGVVKVFAVSEKGPKGEDDPAGDDFPEETLIEALLPQIKAV